MKFYRNIRPAVIFAAFHYLLFVTTNCVAQNPPKKSKEKVQSEYEDYDYGDGYNYKNVPQNAAQSYDYAVIDKPTKPSFIMCYDCTFHVLQGHEMGPPNCKDPFVERDIGKVECTHPCGIIYTKLDDKPEGGDFMVNRNCLEKCKEQSMPRGYTKCCTKSLCNGASSSQSILQSRCHVLLSIVFSLVIVLRLRNLHSA